MAVLSLLDLRRPAAVAPLCTALQDPEPAVRLSAAIALGELAEGAGAPALRMLLATCRSEAERRAATWALRQIAATSSSLTAVDPRPLTR